MSDSTTAADTVKKFVFTSKVTAEDPTQQHEDRLEVFIPELLQASYSFYTWPSAPILAWFLWEHRNQLPGKRVLELGSGTALPGIVAAKCGAIVTLTDSVTLPKSLAHIRRSCAHNKLVVGRDINVVGLSWGLFFKNTSKLSADCVDIILGSDCFYEPTVFEEVLVTVAFLIDGNSAAKFLCTYQERSSDWSIEHLLAKWRLKCIVHNIDSLGVSAGVDIHKIIGDHTIQLVEIFR